MLVSIILDAVILVIFVSVLRVLFEMTRLLSLCGVTNAISWDLNYAPLSSSDVAHKDQARQGCLRRRLFVRKSSSISEDYDKCTDNDDQPPPSTMNDVIVFPNADGLFINAKDMIPSPELKEVPDALDQTDLNMKNDMNIKHCEGGDKVSVDRKYVDIDGDSEVTNSCSTDEEEKHYISEFYNLSGTQKILNSPNLISKLSVKKCVSRRNRSYTKLINEYKDIEDGHLISDGDTSQNSYPDSSFEACQSKLDNRQFGLAQDVQEQQESSSIGLCYQVSRDNEMITSKTLEAGDCLENNDSKHISDSESGDVCSAAIKYSRQNTNNMENTKRERKSGVFFESGHIQDYRMEHINKVITTQPKSKKLPTEYSNNRPITGYFESRSNIESTLATRRKTISDMACNTETISFHSNDEKCVNKYQSLEAINRNVNSPYCVETKNPMMIEHAIGRPHSLYNDCIFQSNRDKMSSSIRAAANSTFSMYSESEVMHSQVVWRENSKAIKERRGFDSSLLNNRLAHDGEMTRNFLNRKIQSTNELKEKLRISARRQSPSVVSLDNFRNADHTYNNNSPRHLVDNQSRYNKSQSCIITPGPPVNSLRPRSVYVPEQYYFPLSQSSRVMSAESISPKIHDRRFSEFPNRVGSCIFTETMEEDYTPYMPSGYLPSPTKSSPSATPRRNPLTSIHQSPRRSYSTASLYKYPTSHMKENLQPSAKLTNNMSSIENCELDSDKVDSKLKRNQSFRRVLRRASSVNKDLRRKIKSWSPFGSRFDPETGGSSFYSTLEDDLIKEEPEDVACNKTITPDSIKLKQSRLNSQSIQKNSCTKDEKNIYNAGIECERRQQSCANHERQSLYENRPKFESLAEIYDNNRYGSNLMLQEGWVKRKCLRRARHQKSVSICGLPDYIRYQGNQHNR